VRKNALSGVDEVCRGLRRAGYIAKDTSGSVRGYGRPMVERPHGARRLLYFLKDDFHNQKRKKSIDIIIYYFYDNSIANEDIFLFLVPAGHWVYMRSMNPIESTLATVRLSTEKTGVCRTRFKLCVLDTQSDT
jgi:hypothetical protein